MPEQPSVCAIMLTRDRPEMARFAVERFRSQTYAGICRLAIINTGAGTDEIEGYKIRSFYAASSRGRTIGELRNFVPEALAENDSPPDVYIHWDDDDYSYPNRIAEQVALLQASGADCVGYNEMLFWRNIPGMISGEAWLYRSQNPQHALGTSLCYWRKTWERRPFAATSVGEDHQFTSGLRMAVVSSVTEPGDMIPKKPNVPQGYEPRMIARIHGGNTSDAYALDRMQRAKEWKRVPEWDLYCAGVFAK